MSRYLFQHPETGEVKEVVQKMTDSHVYVEDGIEWIRLYTVPQVGIDMNPNTTPEKFISDSANKKGNIGNLMDKSRELSEKRAQVHGGRDPVKDKWFDSYKSRRAGKTHPMDDRKD